MINLLKYFFVGATVIAIISGIIMGIGIAFSHLSAFIGMTLNEIILMILLTIGSIFFNIILGQFVLVLWEDYKEKNKRKTF